MTPRAWRRGQRASYDSGYWWFGAGYLPAGDLRHYWHRGEHRRGRFSITVADIEDHLAIEAELAAMRKIAEALARSHRREDPVHRMKPGTIYHARHIGFCELSVEGFGVSLDLRDPIKVARNETTSVEFVLHNVSPEVVEMLTGARPS